MKKYILYLSVFIISVILCSCVESTNPSLPSNLIIDYQNNPVENDVSVSPSGPTQEEIWIEEFDKLFTSSDSWYRIALYSQYICVDKLQLRDLFWNGFSDETPVSDEEIEQLSSIIHVEDKSEIVRLPVDKMDAVLNTVFGVGFEDMLDNNAKGLYNKHSENCYIIRGTSPIIENYKTVAVEEQEDGALAVTYTMGKDNIRYVVMVIPLDDGGYRVKSNMSVNPMPGIKGETFLMTNDDSVMGQSLYYRDWSTERVFYICDGPIKKSIVTNEYVCYIKADEPNRIYATPKNDFSQHILVYESKYGEIGERIYTGLSQFEGQALEFVEGCKRFVWLDLTTGESQVFMEQYYISDAWVYDRISVSGFLEYQVVDSWKEYYQIYFFGKLSEDGPMREYIYNVLTGEEVDISTEG